MIRNIPRTSHYPKERFISQPGREEHGDFTLQPFESADLWFHIQQATDKPCHSFGASKLQLALHVSYEDIVTQGPLRASCGAAIPFAHYLLMCKVQ
jgi:hypothetical protein